MKEKGSESIILLSFVREKKRERERKGQVGGGGSAGSLITGKKRQNPSWEE
jgi:hypothetical protein